jgi:Domain of unknown function (DUF4407)
MAFSQNDGKMMRPTNKLSRFVYWCSGAPLNGCRSTTYQFHLRIGVNVFFTGIFAFVSSFYLFYSIFKVAGISVFGLSAIWAFCIFHIERLLVSSLTKEANLRLTFKRAVPKLVVAAMIGIVIAHPLVLRMFQSEIQVELRKKHDLTGEKGSEDAIATEFMRLEALIQQERSERSVSLQPLRDSIQCACEGFCGKGVKGRGPACLALEQQLQAYMKASNDKIEQWGLEMQTLVQKGTSQQPMNPSFSAQNQALREICKQPTVFRMYWLVIILFMLTATAPILLKVLIED